MTRAGVGLLLAGAAMLPLGCSPHRTAPPIAPTSAEEPAIVGPPARAADPRAATTHSDDTHIDDAISALERAREIINRRARALDQ